MVYLVDCVTCVMLQVYWFTYVCSCLVSGAVCFVPFCAACLLLFICLLWADCYLRLLVMVYIVLIACVLNCCCFGLVGWV